MLKFGDFSRMLKDNINKAMTKAKLVKSRVKIEVKKLRLNSNTVELK